MSLVENLLSVLSHYPGDYVTICSKIRRHAYSIQENRLKFSASQKTLRVTLSRLKQRGLLENKNGKWEITNLGSNYLDKIRKRLKLPKHTPKQHFGKPKKMIIVFDIPEDQKNKRRWLRIELFNLDFIMLQKSVWLGPTPLSKEFIKSLNDLKLLPYLKFFKASETDIV